MASRRLLELAGQERPSTCPEKQCDANLQLPYLCHVCGSLLRDPPGLSHFERFGLEPSMEVDLAELERRYLDLSRRLHPDRMISKGPKTQSRALVLSSQLNRAYGALKDERLRAEHLLALRGGKTADQDKRTPAAFLMEQMELREELEAAQASGDRAALERARERAQREQAACLARVRELLGKEPCPGDDALLAEVREQLNVVKYWITLEEEMRAALAA